MLSYCCARPKLSWLGSFVQLQCCIHKESSMKNLARLFLALIGLMIGSAGFAQASKPASENPTIAHLLDRSVSNVPNELVPAADAMPEDKHSFAPSHREFSGVGMSA